MKEIKRFRDGSYDYFSTLPESVVLHILSFLPYKDIARTSVLSKTWKPIWINCPNIDLLIHDYRFDSSLIPHVYLGHAGQALCQCLNRKACIQKFRLYLSAQSTIKDASVLEYLDAAMDIIFGALFEKNVSELAIEMHFAPAVQFSIPEKVFLAHCLKVLEIVGCTLEDRVSCIDLPHLQKLKIHRCGFAGESILAQILHGCPGVESVEVSSCYGVGSFLSVSCKPRLKYFSINGGHGLKRIEISVPSLETLKCGLPWRPCVIELDGCANLKFLEIVGVNLSGDCTIQTVLSNLICIEELKLRDCEGDERFQISSSCLKRLIMKSIGCFPGAEIDTPNLLSLEFYSPFSFHRSNRFGFWKAPKLEDIEMVFGAEPFLTACRGGLKGFLMQLPNYEDLKLVVEFQYMRKLIMHEKVHTISFSSLNKLVKKMKPEYVVISSRLDETFSGHILGYAGFSAESVTMSLICSSPGALKVVHEKLLNDSKIKKRYLNLDFRAESIDHEVEHENGSAWESFMNTHLIGQYAATIIVSQKPFEELVQRP